MKYGIVIVLISLVMVSKRAQGAGCSKNPEQAWFTFLNNTAENDTIVFIFWSTYQLPKTLYEGSKYKATVCKGETYTVTLSGITPTSRIYAYSYKFGELLPTQLVERRDSLAVSIDSGNNSVKFLHTGKGENKYRLIDSLKILQYENRQLSERIWSKRKNKKAIQNVLDSAEVKYGALLNRNKSSISLKANESLQRDVYWLLKWKKLESLCNVYGRLSKNERFDFVSTVKDELYKPDEVDPTQFSPYTVEYLYYKTKMQLLMESNPDFSTTAISYPEYSWNLLYNRIKSDYEGLLKATLRVYALTNTWDQVITFINCDEQDIANAVKETAKDLPKGELKTAIKRKMKTTIKGAKVIDFSLPDANGKRVSFSDFKRKTVLIEFWSYKCTGCVSFKTNFNESIYPIIKDNDNMVVLSINLDSPSATTNKIVKRLSPKGFINLNLGDEGLEHPLLQYYNLKLTPFIILSNQKGKIVTTTTNRKNLLPIILSELQ